VAQRAIVLTDEKASAINPPSPGSLHGDA